MTRPQQRRLPRMSARIRNYAAARDRRNRREHNICGNQQFAFHARETKKEDVRASAPPPDDYARSIVSAGGSDVSVPLNTLRTAHGTQKLVVLRTGWHATFVKTPVQAPILQSKGRISSMRYWPRDRVSAFMAGTRFGYRQPTSASN